MTRSVACPDHVGRDAEVALVREAVAAASNSGRTLLIAGEAGLGKTRLAQEAVQAATDAGGLVLAGGCLEGAAAAYQPFATALRRHLRTCSEPDLRALFEGPAQLAALLVPELAHTLGIESGPASTTTDVDVALWHLLDRLGRSTPPLLMLVEDVHWADADTLRLLTHLTAEAPSLRMLLVATYRPDELHRRHPLSATLSTLRRLPAVAEIRLQPLGREALRRMLSALFDSSPVGDELLEAVAGRTEGNPFFTEELSAVLVESGDIYRTTEGWDRRAIVGLRLPETVREMLLRRFDGMDDEALTLLRLAAVAGESVEPRVLGPAAGMDEATVDRIVVDALRLEILVEREQAGAARYAFRHALTREALVDELVGPQRRRAHLAIARALETAYAADVGTIAAQAAEHFEEGGDRDRARHYALIAARRACAVHATREAAAHYDRVLRLMAADDPDRLAILVEAAEDAGTDTDREYSAAAAREAREVARDTGDVEAEFRALRVIAQDRWLAGDGAAASAVDREMVALTNGRGDSLEARALASMARRIAFTGEQQDEARAIVARGIELANAIGDDVALSMLHNTRGLLMPDEHDEAFDAAVRYATACNRTDLLANALLNGGYSAAWFGNLDRAADWLKRAVEVTDRTQPGQAGYCRAGLGWALSLRGETEPALALALPLVDSASATTRMAALAAVAEAYLIRGDGPEALAAAQANRELAAASGERQRIEPAFAQLLRAQIAQENADRVSALVDGLIQGEFGTWNHAFGSPDAAVWLEGCGDTSRLARLVEELRVRTEREHHPHNITALAFSEGMLKQSRGDATGAATALLDAAQLYAALPALPRQADALLAAANAWLRAGRPDEATAVARRVEPLTEVLASTRLAAAVADVLARCETEVQLATLLVTDIVGSTDRAITLGDRAWRALLERHHAIVRRHLAAQRGREIDTAGDGFLAAFDSPARAIRCAVEAIHALDDAGIGVRAGLHTGECEVVGEKLVGITVHIAARVAGLAGPGEILVSSTVRDIVAGSGIRLADRGEHTLRGVPGSWRLFAVTERQAGDEAFQRAPVDPDSDGAQPVAPPIDATAARLLVTGLETVAMASFAVVGQYLRFDQVVRHTLKDARQSILIGLERPAHKRNAHLIWAAPGSGKTYFVEQVAASLTDTTLLETNLAKCTEAEFRSFLSEVAGDDEARRLCFIDECDAQPGEAWPYELLLPCLDGAVSRGARIVFVLAGSFGSTPDAMREWMAARPKGSDLISRIPITNVYSIPPMDTGDRVLVALTHLRAAARENGHDLSAVEKMALYYMSVDARLGNARQLREFAFRAAERLLPGEDRVKYDHLFDPGDPENKAFWVQCQAHHAALVNRFVAVTA